MLTNRFTGVRLPVVDEIVYFDRGKVVRDADLTYEV